jgi:SAM-dependent methyltransferase
MTDDKMDAYFRSNRELWNGWAEINYRSTLYNVKAFKAGQSSLHFIEREALGDVAGKSLLHLQCHFGMDTLSWARLGAQVTGVDLSPRAVELAHELSAELAIPARFLCANLHDLPDLLQEQFDIVFTSYGVVGWLPDLNRWARLIHAFLKPGGVFFIVEFHPIIWMLDNNGEPRNPYFHPTEPERSEERGSYSDPNADFSHVSYNWGHTLGETVTALIASGLRLEELREYPYSAYNCFPFTEEIAPGRSIIRGRPNSFPLMYSIRATKE